MQHRAFRYRLYPNTEQQSALAVQFGHARFVYNWGLATRKQHYQQYTKGLSYYELKRQLTRMKHTPEFNWLREADSQVLQAKLEDLDRAYRNFFEKRGGIPGSNRASRCSPSATRSASGLRIIVSIYPKSGG